MHFSHTEAKESKERLYAEEKALLANQKRMI
jgi:hypothetical protein